MNVYGIERLINANRRIEFLQFLLIEHYIVIILVINKNVFKHMVVLFMNMHVQCF